MRQLELDDAVRKTMHVARVLYGLDFDPVGAQMQRCGSTVGDDARHEEKRQLAAGATASSCSFIFGGRV
ncbi:unnamed protein product [Amoebophrya sp. A25]|nr:unnamed protein product [Amoebophrya sp. A25]|eukprot:GSA25T00007283001.1